MTTPRLPLLWPVLFKAVETPAVRSSRAAIRFNAYHVHHPRRQAQSVPQKRYGSANEPPAHLTGGNSSGPLASPNPEAEVENKALPKIAERLQKDGEAEIRARREPENTRDGGARRETTTIEGTVPAQTATHGPSVEASSGEAEKDDPTPTATVDDSKPVESLLDSVPHPSQKEQAEDKAAEVPHDPAIDEHSPPIRAPHIEPPRYVHHFDTYGLVRRLAEGSWSEEQAITIMKAVRLRLAENMGLAKEALVSKSMVENETYLFRAACAELKTEVTSRRKAEQEKMRTERTQLQHEVDILGQRMGQENAAMKDELKGMFDDRKMAVRNEQRSMESRLQQINYKITVELQADAKSEVEGLRWVMTRRVIIALVTVVFMVLGSLKIASDAYKDNEAEAKKRSKVTMVSGGTQTEEQQPLGSAFPPGEIVVREGDNPGYVSLG